MSRFAACHAFQALTPCSSNAMCSSFAIGASGVPIRIFSGMQVICNGMSGSQRYGRLAGGGRPLFGQYLGVETSPSSSAMLVGRRSHTLVRGSAGTTRRCRLLGSDRSSGAERDTGRTLESAILPNISWLHVIFAASMVFLRAAKDHKSAESAQRKMSSGGGTLLRLDSHKCRYPSFLRPSCSVPRRRSDGPISIWLIGYYAGMRNNSVIDDRR
jgi:hypothetical protein